MNIKAELNNNPTFYGLLFMGFVAILLVLISIFQPPVEQPLVTEKWGTVPELWVDPETNCQYFRVAGGITPRLGTDGFPLCNFELPVGSE